MPVLTCTRTQLQQGLLRQQCLSAPVESVERAITRILGCRAAEGSTPYLSLLWRVADFKPADFDKAVHEDRSLLRVKGPRGTYFWVTPALAPLFLAAAHSEPISQFLLRWGIQEGEYRAIEEAVTLAATRGPVGLSQLKKRIPMALQRPVYRKGSPASTALAVALEAMQFSGQVTLLKAPGFDRHRSREYYGDVRDVTRPNLVGLVAELYPELQVESWEPTEARRHLLEAYIKAYGPVTVEDMTWWTGWTKREVREHLRSLAAQLIEVYVPGLNGTFLVNRPTWSLEGGTPVDTPPLVHLLPGGDSLTKGYDGFGRFLVRPTDDENVLRFMPTVLCDGLGKGNWAYRITATKVEVVVQLFETVEESLLHPFVEAAIRTGQFITDATLPVEVSFQTRSGRWNPRESFPLVES